MTTGQPQLRTRARRAPERALSVTLGTVLLCTAFAAAGTLLFFLGAAIVR